jgi:hypothetical protein
MKNIQTEENLYDYVFHYNPYDKVWSAIPRESQHSYWNGNPSEDVIKSSKIETLVELITKGRNFVQKIK